MPMFDEKFKAAQRAYDNMEPGDDPPMDDEDLEFALEIAPGHDVTWRDLADDWEAGRDDHE